MPLFYLLQYSFEQLCCICYNVDMKYNIAKDIEIACKILDLSYSSLAEELWVPTSTITRIVKEGVYPNDTFLESFYTYFNSLIILPVKLNEQKVRFAKEQYGNIYFHGCKTEIDGPIDLNHSRKRLDLGIGFYLGENYKQASSYISQIDKSSIYLFVIEKISDLKIKEFDVSLEWMLVVSYFRGALKDYENSKVLKNIITEVEQYDIIIAPIADNNMYDIMGRFAEGLITDQQAILSMSISKLGKQYAIKTKKACDRLKIIDRLYLCKNEREYTNMENKYNLNLSMKESKTIIEKNRRVGKYIEEILK